ncbi:DnaJ-like protein xdj1 [Elasticomyces elasticus]|nr:DnaJ-like protein xdj1 [Elasticomyces elasticus]
MLVDTILYDTLGVPPNSTHERIRIAYKRSAVECHPDKAAQDDRSQASANEKFILVHEAYKVLRTDKLRKDYDKKGFKAATGREPGAKGSNDIGYAKRSFASFASSGENGAEEEDDMIAELLDWWSHPGNLKKTPLQSLRLPQDSSLYEQLIVLYDQFRLTHSSTTAEEELSERASAAILNMTKTHFGAFHLAKLTSWGEQDVEEESVDLQVSENGRHYKDIDGELQPIPSSSSIARLPDGLEMIHLSSTTEFEKLLNAAPGREKVAAQTLDRNHGVQYQALWDQLEADNSHNLAHTDFNKRIDWREIAQTLKQLRKKPHDQKAVTKFKLAENKWKSYVKVYGLPRSWDGAVTDLIRRSAPEYHGFTWPQTTVETDNEEETTQSAGSSTAKPTDGDSGATDVTMENASSTNGGDLDPADDDNLSIKSLDTPTTDAPATSKRGRVADSSVWVRDGDAQREVFAFRQIGAGGPSQLVLRMTTPEATFALFDIVSAKMFNRTVELIKTQPARDFGKMKGGKDDLKNRDYADLTWVGIATQRRGIAPDDGWPTQPHTYMLSQNQDGTVRAFTRSDVGAVFGRASIDVEIHNRRLAADEYKALPAPPVRRRIAWGDDRYDSQAGMDVEDDLAMFTTTHPHDTKLLQHEGQQEQHERDIMSNFVRALGKGTRVPGIDKARERREPQREEYDEALTYLEDLSLAAQSGSPKK